MGTDDYAHGAYFAWSDHRGSDFDVYATRIGPGGQPLPGWAANGNLVAGGSGDQTVVACLNDGPWGTFVVWIDRSSGPPQLYVQRLEPGGGPASGWPAGGRALCLEWTQETVWAFSDRQGGLQFLWIGERAGGKSAIAHHMAPDGSPYAGWPACGIQTIDVYDSTSPCCTHQERSISDAAPCWPDGMFIGEHGYYSMCEFCCDACIYYGCGSSTFFQGATFTQTESDDQCGTGAFWPDEAGGFFQIQYYSGTLVRTGVLGNPSWRRYLQTYPPVIRAGDGSYYVQSGVGVLRILNDGSNAPGWTSASPVCDPPCEPFYAWGLAPDGAGNLYVAWVDTRSGASGLYATLVMKDGSHGTLGPASGLPVALGVPHLDVGPVVSDRRGSAIVSWRDDRRGEYDLYAYRLTTDVPISALASLVSSVATPRRVEIVWYVPSSRGVLSIDRREDESAWLPIATATSDGAGRARVVDTEVRPGTRYEYRLSSGSQVLSTLFVTVPTAFRLAFTAIRPTPSSGALEVAFSLPDEREVALRVIDAQGRAVIRRRLGSIAAGDHVTGLSRDGDLAPGVYLVELSVAGARLARRAIIFR
jgi:hypothetical protein